MSFFEGSGVGNDEPAASGSEVLYTSFEQPKPKRRWPVRSIIGYGLTLVFMAGVAYAFNAPTPYVIEEPGTVFDVLGADEGSKIIDIKGAHTYDDSGKLFLLTVRLHGQPGSTPNWFEVWQAWNDPKKNVLPIDLIYPPGVDATDSNSVDLQMMQDSQQQATAAALRQLGYKIPNKVKVLEVDKAGAAYEQLKVDDFITAVDGAPLANGDELRSQVRLHATKKPMKLTVLRGDKSLQLEIAPKKLNGAWRLGISIVDTYVFPFDVKLQLQNVGGPSGGMMFALGIIDKLTPGSLTGGQAVAGTGEINGLGEVGPIGGIQQKMYAAVDNGATWFLAPASNCDEVVGHIPSGLHVTKVSTLSDALAALKAISQNSDTTALPQCTATN